MIALLASLSILSAPLAGPQDGTRPHLLLEALDGTVSRRGPDAAPLASLAAAGAAFVRFGGVPERAAGAEVPLRDRASLVLAGGDRLTAAIRGGAGDTLTIELLGGTPLDLSIDAIRSVVFPARIPDGVTESPAPGDDGDRLYLATGQSLDRAVGFVESFGTEAVTFEDARLGAREFRWERVVALFVTPLDEEIGPGPDAADGGDQGRRGERVAVSLVGGGRLSGELVEIRGPVAGLTLRLGGSTEVRLPGDVVREVALDDGSFTFLGDLERSGGDAVSLFGDEVGYLWPVRVDRNCKGGPLLVGGKLYDRGLGVHAPSRLAWDLAGKGWGELRIACGVDDSAQSTSDSAVRGSVRFRVLGDGEVLWESDVHRAGAPALRPGAIDVSGVAALVLEVDPGSDFVLDRANWLRPMLVRAK